MLIKIVSILILIAVVIFVGWSYMTYFKFEGERIDTSRKALETAREAKTALEARDKALLQVEQMQGQMQSNTLQY